MAVTDQILNLGNGGYRGVLSTADSVSRGLAGVSKKVLKLGEEEVTPGMIRDLNTNGFLAQNSVYKPYFFARAFDEPTYLSFRIEFIFNDPVRNNMYNNVGITGDREYGYYSTMYDYMPEPFLQGFGEFKNFLPGKNGEDVFDTSLGITMSSEDYLDRNIGDHARAMLLHNFKAALKDVSDNFPYYFTSLNGLDTLTSIEPDGGIRVKDGVITLDCMEGLDLKITQLLQMYRKIVWDDTYQRWVLPDMMRYFGMRIYVSEIRLFSDIKTEEGNGTK